MTKQTTDNNSILLYHAKIESGDIIACNKIYKTYNHLADKVLHETEWYYSPNRADHVVVFFEQYLRHSKGKMGGKPVILELWEKAMLSAQYGFINIEGIREYTRCILIVGKKNGKSFISSGEGLYLLSADGEPGPEVYSVATKRDQAKIIWDESRRMRNKSPALAKRIRATINELRYDTNDGVFKPLASDTNTMDGLNVHGALLDEWHQWKNGRPLYNIVADGVSAREQPMIFMTSTAGTVREDIYDEIYDECEDIVNGYGKEDGYKDERTLPLIYELDNRKEYTDEKSWIKANPNLGVSKSYTYLKEKVDRAKNNPIMLKNVLCKEFNIRETSSESWLSYEQLNNTDVFELNPIDKKMLVKELDKTKNITKTIELAYPRYGIGGLDLSNTTDLTCATIIFKVPDDNKLYVKQMYWLPSDLLEKRITEDKIPYDKWLDQGRLRLSEGKKINYKDVTNWFIEVQNDLDIFIYKIGYDSWNSQYIVDELQQNFGKFSTEPIIQGAKTMSSPMKVFATDLEAKLIVYDNNPVLKWCLANAAIQVDRNDNITLCKTSNPRRRIDGVASLLDAYICLDNNLEDYMSMI